MPPPKDSDSGHIWDKKARWLNAERKVVGGDVVLDTHNLDNSSWEAHVDNGGIIAV